MESNLYKKVSQENILEIKREIIHESISNSSQKEKLIIFNSDNSIHADCKTTISISVLIVIIIITFIYIF
jgi:hypothetical protein